MDKKIIICDIDSLDVFILVLLFFQAVTVDRRGGSSGRCTEIQVRWVRTVEESDVSSCVKLPLRHISEGCFGKRLSCVILFSNYFTLNYHALLYSSPPHSTPRHSTPCTSSTPPHSTIPTSPPYRTMIERQAHHVMLQPVI